MNLENIILKKTHKRPHMVTSEYVKYLEDRSRETESRLVVASNWG